MRAALLLLAVAALGVVESGLGWPPSIGLALAVATAAAFVSQLGGAVLIGSTAMALAEWSAGLPVGAWPLGTTVGLVLAQQVVHRGRPGLLDRGVALVLVVVPGLLCTLVFAVATGNPTGVSSLPQALLYLATAVLLSGLTTRVLIGNRARAWSLS
jgi:hypothetical protein